MKTKSALFQPGCNYHIYNRGNNREDLFYTEENYNYFLRRYDYYLNDFVETYAYCLLPNHFHLLIRVRDKINLPGIKNIDNTDAIPSRDDIDSSINKIISQQFRRLIISYSQAINKQQNRIGSLFQKPFKRIHIDNLKYLSNMLFYIHTNPQRHKLINNFRNWPYSSYGKYLGTKKSHLPKKEVLNWFGSVDEYRQWHKIIFDFKDIDKYI